MLQSIVLSLSLSLSLSLAFSFWVMAAQLDMALGGSAISAWPSASGKKRTSGAFWEEEVVQLMMGRPLHQLDATGLSSHASSTCATRPALASPPNAACSTTLDLLGGSSSSSRRPALPRLDASEEYGPASSSCFDLDVDFPLPSGWEKCLDLQTGSIYYLNRSTGLSTSCDPRKATGSSVNWPTSPSSSSDLTFEANVPMAASSKPTPNTFLEGSNNESANLDLTLSLKPSSPCARPHSLVRSLNHDLKSDSNYKINSLIAPQAPLNKQNLSSSISSLPFNSARTSFALPSCTSATAPSTSSSSSVLFFQDLCAVKDMGSMGTSISSKESKCVSMNGFSRHISNNVSMSAREKPYGIEAHTPSPISKNFNVSAKSKPTHNDIHLDASSPMMTVGCANCLMFVMLPKSCSPKCPRCGAFIDPDLPQPLPTKKPKLGFSFFN